jgi:aminopeptidase N
MTLTTVKMTLAGIGRASLIVAILFVASVQLLAQSTSLDRPRVYDVKNYVIRLSFDRSKKLVFGDTTVELTPLEVELSSVDLDAVDLNFVSVRLESASKDLQFSTERTSESCFGSLL